MRVAVVTPFHRTRPDWLAQCHASVRRQTHACTHILVSDGSGEPPLAEFSGQLVLLGRNHADFGDTPRAVGSMSAIGQGFDAIAYLDADNWYRPEHVATLVALHRSSGAAVCSSARTLHALDGRLLGRCPETDGARFVDTNCLFLTRAAFPAASAWVLMPPEYHVVDDRWVWAWIRRQGWTTAHTGQPTAAYRTGWPHHYRLFSQPVPDGAKSWDFSHECARRIEALARQSGDGGTWHP
ncbi:MAG: glycosyltransferase [Gammaproteobacteria bacterium]|nr:glycosyltransferase [Gammaproteobacteria bacterium]